MVFGSFNQAYFMGLLFLIGGYFVPASFDRRGAKGFMIERLIRLGAPTLLYMVAINPLVEIAKMLFTHDSRKIWNAYWQYLSDFSFLKANGPLWFAEVLLALSLLYAIIRAALPRRTHTLPMIKVSHTLLCGLVLGMGAITFVVRLWQPMGSAIYNFQLSFFTQYIVMFGIGVFLGRHNGLQALPAKTAMIWFLGALGLGSILWGIMAVSGGALSGNTAPYAGGWLWQAVAYAFWESFFCVGACIGLLAIFRDHCNGCNRLGRFLSANAFGVYVFHPPVLVAASLALRPLPLTPVAKAILAALIVLPLCFLFSAMAGRIPGIRRIIH